MGLVAPIRNSSGSVNLEVQIRLDFGVPDRWVKPGRDGTKWGNTVKNKVAVLVAGASLFLAGWLAGCGGTAEAESAPTPTPTKTQSKLEIAAVQCRLSSARA